MRVVLLGREEREEFQRVGRDVRMLVAAAGSTVSRLRRDDVSEARIASLPRDLDFAILLRSYPSEFSPFDVARLRRVAPLAPIVAIDGALCEGSGRRQEPLEGARRITRRAWFEVYRLEFERYLARDGGGLFAQPVTFSPRDGAAYLGRTLLRPRFIESETGGRVGRALVLSERSDARRALVETLTKSGVNAIGKRIVDGLSRVGEEFDPTWVVVDSPAVDSYLVLNVRVRARYPRAQQILLTFAPQFEEERALASEISQGRAILLSKPYEVGALIAALER